MNIIDILNNEHKTQAIDPNDPAIKVYKHLQRHKFRAVIQNSNEGRFLDHSYLTDGFYFAEFHDDGHFYFWIKPEHPLIDTVISKMTFGLIKGQITIHVNKTKL